MQLKDYIPNIHKKYSKIFFSGISFDSSKVKKNSIFFAIKGDKFDGNDYIDIAIKKGARIIVSEKKNNKKKNIIFLRSLNVRKLLAEVSYKILNQKPKKIVAVTGTNGKSSIADFYYQILDLNSKKVASILQTTEKLLLLNGKIASGPSFKKYCLAFLMSDLCLIVVVIATSL